MSHPSGLPDVFLDRSLGRVQVPALLRAAGLRLTTLAEHYGIPEDESVPDELWLEMAGRRGWVVFAKDSAVRRNPRERAAIATHRVRYFFLAAQSLTAREMADRFVRNLDRITLACAGPGPQLIAVHATRIEELEF